MYKRHQVWNYRAQEAKKFRIDDEHLDATASHQNESSTSYVLVRDCHNLSSSNKEMFWKGKPSATDIDSKIKSFSDKWWETLKQKCQKSDLNPSKCAIPSDQIKHMLKKATLLPFQFYQLRLFLYSCLVRNLDFSDILLKLEAR